MKRFGREGLVVKVWCFDTVVVIRDGPMGTKTNWVNSWNCFSLTPRWLQIQKNIMIYSNHHETIHIF